MIGYVNSFEEAGILRGFIVVLDYVDSTPATAERYYRGYVGKVMDHVCEELHGLLYEAIGSE
jgi:peptide deformylase